MHMRQMERFFNELTSYTEEQKREIVCGHMRDSKDRYIQIDLGVFDEAGDRTPVGWQFSFDYLWQSMRRRVGFYTKTTATVKRSEATAREIEKVK